MLQYSAFIFATLLISAFAKCPPGSVYRHQKCYKFHPEISPFDTANLSCSILNGYLAIIYDKEENDFLTRESKEHFGGVEPSDAWISEKSQNDNETFTNFKDQGLKSEGRNCVSLKTDDGFWAISDCSKDIRKPYICEYELPINTISPPSSRNSTAPATSLSSTTTVVPVTTTTVPSSVSVTTTLQTTISQNPATANQKLFKCPETWLQFNEFCYQLSPKVFNWNEAEAYCVTQNAHLVSIHNDDEFKFIDEFDKNHECYWTGLHSEDENKKIWKYTDDTAFDFVKFLFADQKELDSRYSKCIYSCGHYFANANNCEYNLHGICKKAATA